jgi:hypothetical protein
MGRDWHELGGNHGFILGKDRAKAQLDDFNVILIRLA